MRRVITAREQVQALSPWRYAGAYDLHPWQTSEIDHDAPDLTQVAELPEHGGRWAFPHEKFEPDKYNPEKGYHSWGVHPTDAPAQHDWSKMDRPRTIYYNPELTDIHQEDDPDFGPISRATNNGNRMDDIHPDKSTPGMIWRGMSHEELENAKQNGYIQSNGSYNFEGQEGTTLFDEKASSAGSYASHYAPYQHEPTFSRPGHVIGIPDKGYPRNSVGEVEVPGRVPLSEVTHHYRGDVVHLSPGSYGGYKDPPNPEYGYNGFKEQPSRRMSPMSAVQWSPGELHRGNPHTAAAVALPNNDPLWALLEPTSEWGYGRSTRDDPPPPTPAEPEPPRQLPDPIEGVPRGREHDYQNYSQQEDQTHTTHLWMPTDVVNHYREWDHSLDDDQTVTLEKAIREHGGVRSPLTLTANATHGLITEGNHRLAIAKKLGIPELPVRVLYHPTEKVYNNAPTGRPPSEHHPAVAEWMDRNRHLFPLTQEKHTVDRWRKQRDEGLQGDRL